MKSETFICLTCVLMLEPISSAQNASTLVTTQSGYVEGVIEGDVRAFRGIPFAAPPIGDLRWRPPAPPASWTGIRDASMFGNVCPQISFDGSLIGNEDCLVLNVFTSASISPTAHQPVMVFFHGGGDTGGSTQQIPFDSPPLAAHGVVVVTAEYRLGSLGFFVHPLLTREGDGSSGNYGLMDQIAALTWVQRNIAAFGGDHSRVMAFGQSSGAADVQVLLASPAAQGLFARAGIESDSIPLHFTRHLSVAEADQAPLVTRVGCDAATDVLACLRSVAADVLVTAQAELPTEFVIEPRVLPKDPFAVLQRDGSPVPLLIGSTREEATGAFDDPTQPITAEQYAAKIQTEFGFLGRDVPERVLALYPVSAYDAPIWALVAVDSDVNIICEVRNTARAAAGRSSDGERVDFPVWRYLFTHRIENDPFLNLFRSFHTEELFFLFGHLEELGNPYIPSPDEVQLSELVMEYWTSFAAKGSPNGRGAPHWPRYGLDDHILQIDVTPTQIMGYHNPQCDYLTTLFHRIPVTGP
jgi:para-nitrobenzyl esterase